MLEHKISIYVPSTYDVDKKASKSMIDNMINHVSEFLIKTFGGATATNAQGFYYSNEGKIVKENITILYSYAENIGEAEKDRARDVCKHIARVMKQESVSLEIDNTLDFVTC